MNPIKCVLLRFEHFSEILFSLAHHRHNKITALVSSQAQKQFYELLFINIASYENMNCTTFDQYLGRDQTQIAEKETIVIMDIPKSYQTLYSIIRKSSTSQELVILLPAVFKKYLKFVSKKFAAKAQSQNASEIKIIQTQFHLGQLVDINEKIKQLVESSYDINRAAFYAYGAYIRNFQANLMKRIFMVNEIFMDQLARSFGFTYAPRVKGQGFVKKVSKTTKIGTKQKVKPQKQKKQKKIKSVNKVADKNPAASEKPVKSKQIKTTSKTKPINKNKNNLQKKVKTQKKN